MGNQQCSAEIEAVLLAKAIYIESNKKYKKKYFLKHYYVFVQTNTIFMNNYNTLK